MEDYGFHPRWVAPFYAPLMNANFLHLSSLEQAALASSIRAVSDEIDRAALTAMLHHDNWRPRSVAAWFIGFLRVETFSDAICHGILHHPLHAEAYCFTLARFGNTEAAACMAHYLSRYLAIEQINYESEELSVDWALAALLWLDQTLSTQHAERFLGHHGLWHQFSVEGMDRLAQRKPWSSPLSESMRHMWLRRWDLERTRARLAAVMMFAQSEFDA
jgi:hypothetical protein